ncbi:MAG: alpha/beta hydrolase [Pseudomonadota bacterium]
MINLKKITIALAVLLISATMVTADDFVHFVTPQGSYATLETHRIYYRCVGEGDITIVINHGIGGAAVEWTTFQDRIGAYTKTCAYDRAGYGWSDSGPAPRTSTQAVHELEVLLDEASIAPPYLLIGHSFGGLIARQFAALHPDQLAGLILIEASNAQVLPSRTSHGAVQTHGIDEAQIEAQRASKSGYEAAAGFLNSRRKAIFAQMDELTNFEKSTLQAAAKRLPAELPLLVLTRDPHLNANSPVEERWHNAQLELSKITDNAELLIAKGAGHSPHLERPEIVNQAVLEFLLKLTGDGLEGRAITQELSN